MPFVYRLQKILDFRIRRKEEQLLVVQQAQKNLAIAEQNIVQNNNEIELTKQSQKQADPRMLESFDKYIHHLWEKAKQLEIIRQEKERKLQEEIQILVECEKAVKVLEKHKEKKKDEFIEEEKKAEIKTFSEIAVQRHFQHTQQRNEEELEFIKNLTEAERKIMEGEL